MASDPAVEPAKDAARDGVLAAAASLVSGAREELRAAAGPATAACTAVAECPPPLRPAYLAAVAQAAKAKAEAEAAARPISFFKALCLPGVASFSVCYACLKGAEPPLPPPAH